MKLELSKKFQLQINRIFSNISRDAINRVSTGLKILQTRTITVRVLHYKTNSCMFESSFFKKYEQNLITLQLIKQY